MAKREDINKILIIGSGPIIIGQACEFDYSGTQACKALKNLGYEIVLVNSNPATIMTDPEVADKTYIMPLDSDSLTEIIKKEKPDAVLPNLGGQSGLNLCLELEKLGVLKENHVEVIGVKTDAIERGEDRIAFKETMKSLNIDIAKSEPAYTVKEAIEIASSLGYPVVVRPAYTMGGAGGGLVYSEAELIDVASRGISASLIGQVLIEESVLGWEELELEIVRDKNNNMITVCFIENIDPMGVHTGDSFCSAPMLTISDTLQKRLQDAAYKIVEAIEVIGGTNVQFAHDPISDRIVVIEINPRTSRSSALASKATGFPIALISAMLAAGLTLEEIPYWKNKTLDKYTPCGDYIVIKFARWAFEKFKDSKDKLGTQMKAVGEVMSIGKTYKEALQKAIRSLEIGRYGFGFAKNFNQLQKHELLNLLKEPTSERQFIIYEALRKGATIQEINCITKIKPYFLEQMKELVELEEELLTYKAAIPPKELLIKAKQDGFADKYLATILKVSEEVIRETKKNYGICQAWDEIPVSGVENEFYYYSTYNKVQNNIKPISSNKKIMILGGGPNRIGQGIEFDYCCVQTAFALKKLGFETVIVNCNPETVSTDYDTSDRLYFEPLTVEDILSIYEHEKPLGVITQFGGQTPLNIAGELELNGVSILGTAPSTIDLAEDRDKFREIMEKLNIPMPKSAMAITVEEALSAAKEIGYPLMVRPSYVLGGRGMEIVKNDATLINYMEHATDVSSERPILIDKFLENAIEAEADAICDGKNTYIPAVMEHIEKAGIHSGDSACVIPSVTISEKNINMIKEYTKKIAEALNVCGLMNMQYAIYNDTVYVLEANPRASRTVPLVSKVCNIKMIDIATQIITQGIIGKYYGFNDISEKMIPHFGVKEAVFPFNMFPEVDPILGPEMRSTGEVLGIASNFGIAYYLAQKATKNEIPLNGSVLISVNNADKTNAIQIGKQFHELGFTIFATKGTAEVLQNEQIPCSIVNKQNDGGKTLADFIENKEIDIVINTPFGEKTLSDDSYLRKSAIKNKVYYVTTIEAALSTLTAIRAKITQNNDELLSLQEYHTRIK